MREWMALSFLVFCCNGCGFSNPFNLVLIVFKLDLQIRYPRHHSSVRCWLHSDYWCDTCWTHATIFDVTKVCFRNWSSLSSGNRLDDTCILGTCSVQVVRRYYALGL